MNLTVKTHYEDPCAPDPLKAVLIEVDAGASGPLWRHVVKSPRNGNEEFTKQQLVDALRLCADALDAVKAFDEVES